MFFIRYEQDALLLDSIPSVSICSLSRVCGARTCSAGMECWCFWRIAQDGGVLSAPLMDVHGDDIIDGESSLHWNSEKHIHHILKVDLRFTATQALELGLIDEIVDNIPARSAHPDYMFKVSTRVR